MLNIYYNVHLIIKFCTWYIYNLMYYFNHKYHVNYIIINKLLILIYSTIITF